MSGQTLPYGQEKKKLRRGLQNVRLMEILTFIVVVTLLLLFNAWLKKEKKSSKMCMLTNFDN
jgi:hypothetical protein